MANLTGANPISVPPSEQWDGNDGPWSTFDIHVGTPPQPARVLVSTTVGETWVVIDNNTQGGCLPSDPPACPQSRGGLVNVNQSSTWQDQGILVLGDEVNLPDYTAGYDNGDYGLESLGVGANATGTITLNNQIVAALATKDFYLGNLGVTSRPTNFTNFDDPHPSFLSSLREQNQIPSLTFGYTAGNQYRLKNLFGSLTLGGYDASRFTPNNVSFGFATDVSRDLVVGLQSITYSDSKTTNKELSNGGQLTFVDATVPHIWLPKEVCQAFEDAFGLEYNSTVERYLVNDTLHTKLQEQNPSISFILGNTVSGGPIVNITLPYAAFDLETGSPIVESNHKYFPIRQAANYTQFTLGRTLLQEAYLIVDYDNSNFSISQATFTSAPPQLKSIIAPTKNSTSTMHKTTSVSRTVPLGAVIGAVVAFVLIALSGIAAFFFLRRRIRRRRLEAYERKKREEYDPTAKPEMDGNGIPFVGEMNSENKYGAYDGKTDFEMDGTKDAFDAKLRSEMEGSKLDNVKQYSEMEGCHPQKEMEGTTAIPPVEMYAGPYGLYEMPSPFVNDSGRPSPVSGGIISPQTGRPSPFTTHRRSSDVFSSWGRTKNKKRKPYPRIPDSDAGDAGDISSPDLSSRHDSDTELVSDRHRKEKTRTPTTPNIPSSTKTSTNRSRDRHHNHHHHPQGTGDDLINRLEMASSSSFSSRRRMRDNNNNNNNPQPELPSPIDTFSSTLTREREEERERETGSDRWNWNHRFANHRPPPPPPPPRFERSMTMTTDDDDDDVVVAVSPTTDVGEVRRERNGSFPLRKGGGEEEAGWKG